MFNVSNYLSIFSSFYRILTVDSDLKTQELIYTVASITTHITQNDSRSCFRLPIVHGNGRPWPSTCWSRVKWKSPGTLKSSPTWIAMRPLDRDAWQRTLTSQSANFTFLFHGQPSESHEFHSNCFLSLGSDGGSEWWSTSVCDWNYSMVNSCLVSRIDHGDYGDYGAWTLLSTARRWWL